MSGWSGLEMRQVALMIVSPPFHLKNVKLLDYCNAQLDKFMTSRTPQLLLYGITLAIQHAVVRAGNAVTWIMM